MRIKCKPILTISVERKEAALQEDTDRGLYRERVWNGKAGECFTSDIAI